ncbi:MAG: hypothetical protein JST54_03800 [Deltaproteobacteria bacterium]|nr:hypothetical protein [Deltaproteobacteria bacterium]
MKKLFAAALVSVTLYGSTARADVYMQNPRGSNNASSTTTSDNSGIWDALLSLIGL